jgi:hypothetical protein
MDPIALFAIASMTVILSFCALVAFEFTAK